MGEGKVSVRLAGVVCEVKSIAGLPAEFKGYAILRARSISAADFNRSASLDEIARYLALFPAVRLILIGRERGAWWALAAQHGDARIHLDGPVVVQLAEEGLERFETILARFDGHRFWHERRDPARNPALAAFLREQLADTSVGGLPPTAERLHAAGLAREEREAYAYVRSLLAAARRDQIEVRLTDALAHAGAELRGYNERGDVYVVTYLVDGRQHTSIVRRDDLTVMAAGICLSGQDRHFDLASLVGVLREGNEQGRLVHVDDEFD